MSCCCGSGASPTAVVPEEKRAANVNKEISRQAAKDRDEDSKIYKLLLLGIHRPRLVWDADDQ